MSKIYIVTGCCECPYINVIDRVQARCDKSQKTMLIGSDDKIPDWCPLQEYEDDVK